MVIKYTNKLTLYKEIYKKNNVHEPCKLLLEKNQDDDVINEPLENPKCRVLKANALT